MNNSKHSEKAQERQEHSDEEDETSSTEFDASPRKKIKLSAKAETYDLDLSPDSEKEERHFDTLFKRALNIFVKEVEFSVDEFEGAALDIAEKFKEYSFQKIDFNNTEYLCAYFYKYSTLNASVARNRFQTAFEDCKELQEKLNRKCLNIISLGGGPGTDMIGFLSAMSLFLKKTPMKLNLTVVDSWRRYESLYNIIQFLIREKSFGHVSEIYQENIVNSRFMKVDIKGDAFPLRYRLDLQLADVVLLVRVLNIFKFEEEKEVLDTITGYMKTGALLIIVDTRVKYREVEELEILYDMLMGNFLSEEDLNFKISISPEQILDTYPATSAKCNIAVCRKK